MPRRKFNKRYGWNNQFKNKPIRSDRWDPFPKDHLPFIDDFSVQNFVYSHGANAGIKRKFDDMNTPSKILGKRRSPELTSPSGVTRSAKRRAGSSATRSLFTNDEVATGSTAAAIAGRMAYTGAGMARDALNRRITQGIEDGFASHYRYFYGRSPSAGQSFPGVPGQGEFTARSAVPLEDLAATDGTAAVDAATGIAMRGQYMTEMVEGLESMLPVIEELLPLAILA